MSYYPSARTRGRGCRPKVNICMYREYKGEGVLSVHILWMTSSSLVYSTSYLMYFKHVIFFIAELRGKFCPLFFGKQNYHIYIYTARTFKAITNCNIFTFRHFDWEPFNGKNLHNVYVKIKIFFEPKTILT